MLEFFAASLGSCVELVSWAAIICGAPRAVPSWVDLCGGIARPEVLVGPRVSRHIMGGSTGIELRQSVVDTALLVRPIRSDGAMAEWHRRAFTHVIVFLRGLRLARPSDAGLAPLQHCPRVGVLPR